MHIGRLIFYQDVASIYDDNIIVFIDRPRTQPAGLIDSATAYIQNIGP